MVSNGAFDTGDPVASDRFPAYFAVTATYGLSQVRYVDVSVAGCLAWAEKQAALGHVVSHVWRFDGDNVFSIDDARKETAG